MVSWLESTTSTTSWLTLVLVWLRARWRQSGWRCEAFTHFHVFPVCYGGFWLYHKSNNILWFVLTKLKSCSDLVPGSDPVMLTGMFPHLPRISDNNSVGTAGLVQVCQIAPFKAVGLGLRLACSRPLPSPLQWRKPLPLFFLWPCPHLTFAVTSTGVRLSKSEPMN